MDVVDEHLGLACGRVREARELGRDIGVHERQKTPPHQRRRRDEPSCRPRKQHVDHRHGRTPVNPDAGGGAEGHDRAEGGSGAGGTRRRWLMLLRYHWKRRTASGVRPPKSPSGVTSNTPTAASASWSSWTGSPVPPFLPPAMCLASLSPFCARGRCSTWIWTAAQARWARESRSPSAALTREAELLWARGVVLETARCSSGRCLARRFRVVHHCFLRQMLQLGVVVRLHRVHHARTKGVVQFLLLGRDCFRHSSASPFG